MREGFKVQSSKFKAPQNGSRRARWLGFFLACGLALCDPGRAAADILVVDMAEIVHPVTARFLTNAIETAEREKAALLIVRLNTPGGLMDSMREIIMRMLDARVPIAIYVSPSGARAASAGFLITISADIAAMAPGTNMGAAHPVSGMGEKIDEVMSKKIENDTVAWIKSIAEKRGRNADLADKAVRESKSYTERESLEGKLIEYVCKDTDDLIAQLDGKTVKRFGGQEMTLHLRGQAQQRIEMSQKEKILSFLAHPEVAYLLFMAALLGLYFEFATPGAIFPGVAGGICLILALFAFDVLPINSAGLLLILVAFALFIAEVKVQSFGVLGVGGIIALVIGSLMLFDAPDSSLRVPPPTVLGVSLAVALIVIFLLRLAVKAMGSKTVTGEKGLVGEIGTVFQDLHRDGQDPEGKVQVHGEFWNAVSVEGDLPRNERVEVVEVTGLRLMVKKKTT
ncbi:MAG: nodulation protein NfeD [Acidobacteria bacterium]|nr:nodulation protein NfeD [Acidobacteriota bacterium]